MKQRLLILALAGILALVTTSPILAETVVEAWRAGGFWNPRSVSANPTDGSCWAADSQHYEVVHLQADGVELWRGGGQSSFAFVWSVSVNSSDGSCWVVGSANDEVVHLAEDGTELCRVAGCHDPWRASANPTDGSCWVAELFNDQIVHLAADGAQLWRGGVFSNPVSVSVNPTDGSCWVGDSGSDEVVHLAVDGEELWRGGGFDGPGCVAVNEADGSCWIADGLNDQVVHLAPDGEELWRGGSFWGPISVSVDPVDGSCWVADQYNDEVVHLAEDGTELSRAGGFDRPQSVSVDSANGSCWVADIGNDQIAHLAVVHFPDIRPPHWAFSDIAVCFRADIVAGYDDGTYQPEWDVTRDQMAVYIARAKGWVSIDDDMSTAPELFPDVPAGHWAGTAIQACLDNNVVAGYPYPDPDNPGETIYLYAPSATVTRDQMAVFIARSICDPTGDEGLVGYIPASPRNFPDVPATGCGDDGTDPYWAYAHIEYCVEHGVVQGYEYPDPDTPGETFYLYQPLWPVTRDQMAVYIARAFELAT